MKENYTTYRKKILGIHIESSLNWTTHINNVNKKLSSLSLLFSTLNCLITIVLGLWNKVFIYLCVKNPRTHLSEMFQVEFKRGLVICFKMNLNETY